MKNNRWIPLVVTLFLAPAVASAHPGHGGSFAAGALHPLSGLDHLATMLAIGLWASQLGARLRWAVPASFLAMMLAGACVGLAGGPGAGSGTQAIAASLVLLGLLIAVSRRLPWIQCLLLAAGFAFFHGYAHGAEAPAEANAASYLAGMLLASVGLQAAGLSLGAWLERRGAAALTRWLGGAAIIVGLALMPT